MATKLRRLETYSEMLIRLAGAASKRGIRIYTYNPTGDYFATSRSQPSSLHRVTKWSCDCEGFRWHRRCTHYAALLEQLGELPPMPEPGSGIFWPPIRLAEAA